MMHILLSDWTLDAFKQREEERRGKEQAEAALVPLEEVRSNVILLSDWTLDAFKQREEERRSKEQAEAALVPLEEVRSNEILLSDWTLDAFKQREEERRSKEQAEADFVPRNEEAQRSNKTLLSDWTLIAFKQREEQWRSKERAEFAETTIEDELDEAASRAIGAWRAQREKLQRDHGEISARATRKLASVFFSIVVTALIAGAIGFGLGIYLAPIEETAQFCARVKDGLDSIRRVMHPNEENTDAQPAKAPLPDRS
jgi:hypothetical protein